MKPNRTILLAMARAERPLNRNELKCKYTKLPKQTIYDWIRRMEHLGWIVEKTGTRSSRPTKRYELTELGLFQAAKYASDHGSEDHRLYERLRKRLGSKYEEYEQKATLGHRQHVKQLTDMIGQVLLSGKAYPGWSLRLEMNANQEGAVRSWMQVGPPISTKSRRRHHQFN